MICTPKVRQTFGGAYFYGKKGTTTCVLGSGFIDDREVKQGDSFFVPANHGKYTLKGDLVAIITKI